MKIHDLLRPQDIQAGSGTEKNTSSKPGDEFAALLDGEISRGGNAGEDAAIPAIGSAFNLAGLTGLAPDTGRNCGITAVEDVLSTLQSLEQGLKEGASPKDVQGVIDRMTVASDKLRESVINLPEDDPLSEMAEEINVTAYMESVKWRRGDYI